MRYIIPLAISLLIFTACKSDKKPDEIRKKAETISHAAPEAELANHNSKVVYRVPTPIEFFMFFYNAGGSFKPDRLLSTDDAARYLSMKEKAIAFGLYASDLAYSAVFGQNQQTISYFETNKALADDLGFTRGYGKDLMQRFRSNLDNVDSLYNLTADSYWEVFKFLEDQDKVELLSYITVAGWVESLYLSYNALDKFKTNEITNSLADQQYVLENLKAYLEEVHPQKYESDNVFKLISDINQAYMELYNNPDSITMTKEQFENIKKRVNESRAMLVK